MKIAVVVPTVRPESYKSFLEKWEPLFEKHQIDLITVFDGESPRVELHPFGQGLFSLAKKISVTVGDVMGEYADLIYNFNDGVRNLGFALAHKKGYEVIISLDDDTEPFGDTIQDHLDVLNKKFPISWMNTTNEIYMRGFPYGVREEAECVLSHGVWKGVADFDASTQLVLGSPALTYPRMPVPRGVLFPMCIMNVAFKAKIIPFMYQAPMGYQLAKRDNINDMNRFADIWGGIEAKKSIDAQGWCAVTGFATVKHERASNAFANLVKEAVGIGMNEKYGDGYYFSVFQNQRLRWQQFLMS